MADKTAVDRLNDFMATGPQPEQFKKSRTIGKGKSSKVIDEIDMPAYQQQRQQWEQNNADTISSLRSDISVESQGKKSSQAATDAALALIILSP